MGYYDSFRNVGCKRDIKMEPRGRHCRIQVERKPHREGAALQTLWLCTGTNYRKMVEPLDIAAYHREGGRNYITTGGSKHYTLLEQRCNEEEKGTSSSHANCSQSSEPTPEGK
ncbi:hypothetical protein PVL29_019185 [Vitis rotundifolia]|uniref:EDS1 EP domain-containing protein n=1 Tax=Vitis rotundifolia TaxID=103349 RepID=A0AA38Z7K9_VITRO|nr:hypothetical protein PVL29_019185 [Vitis rotundifolia]